MRGLLTEVDFGSWKTGETAPLKIAVAAQYYQYLQGGQSLIEIDLLNGIEMINGVDRLAAMRGHLGIP